MGVSKIEPLSSTPLPQGERGFFFFDFGFYKYVTTPWSRKMSHIVETQCIASLYSQSKHHQIPLLSRGAKVMEALEAWRGGSSPLIKTNDV